MALGALGVTADQLTLRGLANQQMGFADPDTGTSWESLAFAAKANGISTEGLSAGKRYKTWSLDDLTDELKHGRPVMRHSDRAFRSSHLRRRRRRSSPARRSIDAQAL